MTFRVLSGRCELQGAKEQLYLQQRQQFLLERMRGPTLIRRLTFEREKLLKKGKIMETLFHLHRVPIIVGASFGGRARIRHLLSRSLARFTLRSFTANRSHPDTASANFESNTKFDSRPRCSNPLEGENPSSSAANSLSSDQPSRATSVLTVESAVRRSKADFRKNLSCENENL